MKTTLDLPDDLLRSVKVKAAQENRRLKDLVAELIRKGLESPSSSRVEKRNRVQLPIIPMPDGKEPFELTNERILELEMAAEAGNEHDSSL